METLVYVDDDLPGISRRKRGTGWSYYDARGELISDREERRRLESLALPPAYENVWYCPSPDGHIQATGYDKRGRKQYRYHDQFRAEREAEKYAQCEAFGRKLPLIRARVASDLDCLSLDKSSIVAAVVRVLDLGKVRVGNKEYARQNGHYGATTLKAAHAAINSDRLQLAYIGKAGKRRRIAIDDRDLVQIVRECQDLPGSQLFQYVDGAGKARPVDSGDVNDYIREAMGADFTAKNFRTWGASAFAFKILVKANGSKTSLAAILEPVSRQLGNTKATSRKSYVHPSLIEIAKNGTEPYFRDLKLPRRTKYLSRYERGLLQFLEIYGLGDDLDA